MKIKEIVYERREGLGKFEHHQIQFTGVIDEDDDPVQLLDYMKQLAKYQLTEQGNQSGPPSHNAPY